ncbi:MAG: hypothetical protein KC493_10495 [Bacteriovoracaceae bacterium]|nr:hypothetical protein [Bacteriovoracaceae bacterium]
MKYLILILCVALFSCSSFKKVDYQKDHQTFLGLVEKKKSTLSNNDYRIFLKNSLNQKTNVETNLLGQMDNLKGRVSHNEVMSTSSNQDAHLFNAKSSGLEMKRIDERLKILKKEIFFLRSQLHATQKEK